MRVAFDRQIAPVLSLVFHGLWRPLNMLIIDPRSLKVATSVLYVPTSTLGLAGK